MLNAESLLYLSVKNVNNPMKTNIQSVPWIGLLPIAAMFAIPLKVTFLALLTSRPLVSPSINWIIHIFKFCKFKAHTEHYCIYKISCLSLAAMKTFKILQFNFSWIAFQQEVGVCKVCGISQGILQQPERRQRSSKIAPLTSPAERGRETPL